MVNLVNLPSLKLLNLFRHSAYIRFAVPGGKKKRVGNSQRVAPRSRFVEWCSGVSK